MDTSLGGIGWTSGSYSRRFDAVVFERIVPGKQLEQLHRLLV